MDTKERKRLYHLAHKNNPAYRLRRYLSRKRWEQNNKDKTKAQRERYNAKHSERRKEQRKKYYRTHKEICHKRNLEWRTKNKDKIREYARKFRETHKEWVKNHHANYRKTKQRKEQLKRWRANNKDKCYAHYLANDRLEMRDVCEKCGKKAIYKHHPDYKNPLDVVFLCAMCHADVHRLR